MAYLGHRLKPFSLSLMELLANPPSWQVAGYPAKAGKRATCGEFRGTAIQRFYLDAFEASPKMRKQSLISGWWFDHDSFMPEHL